MNVTLDKNDDGAFCKKKAQNDNDLIKSDLALVEIEVKLIKLSVEIDNVRIKTCRFYEPEFQMAGKANQGPKKETQSLLDEHEEQAEQDSQQVEEQSQDQGPSQLQPEQGTSQGSAASQQDGLWSCPKCPKRFKTEKPLKNHIEKKHGGMDESLDESNFAPSRSSTHESAVELGEERDRKRKRGEDYEDIEDSDEEMGEKSKPRLKSIAEEEDVDLALLDDTMEGRSLRHSTQGILSEAAELRRQAENRVINMSGDEDNLDNLDDSIERDKDKALEVLQEKLRLREDLCNNKDAKIAEKDADLAEAQELNDQKDRIIRKAMAANKEFEEKIKKLEKRVAEAERAREKERREKEEQARKKASTSPSKEKLKEEIEKSANTIKCLTGRMENLKKDLEISKRNQRKHESDLVTFQKLQLSLEQTAKKLAEVDQELQKAKKEKAGLLKRIPCTLEGCNRGRFCENSHLLKYDDRSEPKSKSWRKKVPCKFFLNGGCRDAEKCEFAHERPEVEERYVDEEGEDDSFEAFNNDLANHRFIRLRSNSTNNSRDDSVEIMAEFRGDERSNDPRRANLASTSGANYDGSNYGPRRSGAPVNKRPRVEQPGSSGNFRSGNAMGAEERSRHSVPVNFQRSGERQQTLRMRLQNNRRSVDGEMTPRSRNWSPIRSPPEDLDRSRARDRDLREEMAAMRRGRGNQRGRMMNRGRNQSRGRRSYNQEERSEEVRKYRDY